MDMKIFKTKAKKNLNKNLKPLITATIILMILEVTCYIIAGAISAKWTSYLLVLIVEALFLPGFIKMAMNASKNKKVKIDDFFSETESFFKYLGVILLVALMLFVLGLLEAIAFRSLVAIMFFNNDINIGLSIFLIALGVILIAAILLVLLYLAISFSQVLFILVDKPKLSIKEILSESFDMMENYIIEYFILIISFIGWLILGIFTFGILYIWVIPYMMLTLVYFYEHVKKDYDNYRGGKELDVPAVKPKEVKSASKKTTVKKASSSSKTASKAPAKKDVAAKKVTTTKTTAKKATTTAKATTKPRTTKPSTKKTSK